MAVDQTMCGKSVQTEIKEGTRFGRANNIVIGGGNIFRGVRGQHYPGMDGGNCLDYMGMLAAVLGSLALQRFP